MDFERYGFARLARIIPPSLATFLQRYTLAYERHYSPRPDQWVPGAPAVYGDPVMEQLFTLLMPTLERASGRSLYPTYAYFRVYHDGDALPKHSDRPSCEISVSISLGHNDATPWPLYIEGPLGVQPVLLEPGDGVIYKGCDCPHWREPLQGNSVSQVFFHFVNQSGPHAAWKYDKRTGLNFDIDALRASLLPSLA